MIRLKIFLGSIILTGILSCKEINYTTFNEPQPAGIKNLSEFPKNIRGFYISESPKPDTLEIRQNIILKTSCYGEIKFHRSAIDSVFPPDSFRLTGDTLVQIRTNQKTILKSESDSLSFPLSSYVDTIFQINNDQVLKKFEDFFFLNKRYYDEGWIVKKMEYSKKGIKICAISDNEDIEMLKNGSDLSRDSLNQNKLLSPTKKQFKAFIKNGGFKDEVLWFRLRN